MTKIYYSCHKDNNDSVIIKYRSINEDKAFGWKKTPGLAQETLTSLAGARTIKYNYEPQEGRLSEVGTIAELILKGYSEKPRSLLANLCHWIRNLYCKLTGQPTPQETLSALVDSVKKKSFNLDVSDRIKIQRGHESEKDELQRKIDEKRISKTTASTNQMNAKTNFDQLTSRQADLERNFLKEQRMFALTLQANHIDSLSDKIDPNKSIKENLAILRSIQKPPEQAEIDAKWNDHLQNSDELQTVLKELFRLKEEIPKAKSLLESATEINTTEHLEYSQLLQQQKELNKKIYDYKMARLNAKTEKIKQESAERLAVIDRKIEKYNAISDGLKKFNR